MNESVNISILLPTQIEETLNVDTSLNVQYLKLTVERNIGIPSELQTIHHDDVILNDDVILDTAGVVEGSTLDVTVDVLWTKLVGLCLKGNNPTLYRRVSVARQHSDESDRVFISLFVSAARGFVSNLTSLLSNYSTFDLKTRTKITGRTLLHAAVGSGHLEGLAAIKKHAGMGFERLLYIQDRWGTSAIDELRTRNESMMHYINKFVSEPRTADQVAKKTRELTRRGSQLFGGAPLLSTSNTLGGKSIEDEKTRTKENKENALTENNVAPSPPQSDVKPPKVNTESSKDIAPKLSRPKISQGDLKIKKGILKNSEDRTRPSTLQLDHQQTSEKAVLPKIKTPTKPVNKDSPRLRRSLERPKSALDSPLSPDSSLSPDSPVSPVLDKTLCPTPPSERKPTAGILKNSASRRPSSAAARKQSSTNPGLSVPHFHRAKSVEPVEKLLTSPPRDRANSAGKVGKVRRISLFQAPPKTSK